MSTKKDDTPRKWGSEHAAAMGRLGVHEIRGALYTESNVAQQSEYGVWGTKTAGEVMQDRRGNGRDIDEDLSKDGDSVLGDRLKEAENRDDRGRDDKDLDLER